MDDYSKEISDLRRQIEAMEEDGSDADQKEIAELKMQLDVLSAIYTRAQDLYESGRGDEAARRGLRLRGYGEWTLDSVYAFVYETAVDEPASGHQEFLDVIRRTDFEGMLAAPDVSAGGSA